jgi:hypothetical protein
MNHKLTNLNINELATVFGGVQEFDCICTGYHKQKRFILNIFLVSSITECAKLCNNSFLFFQHLDNTAARNTLTPIYDRCNSACQ